MRLIDADALKQFEITMPRGDGYSDFVFAGHIHQAPTIDAVPVVHGEWIYLSGLDAFECSVCGRQMVRNIFDYCPWCGAKMDGGKDDESHPFADDVMMGEWKDDE